MMRRRPKLSSLVVLALCTVLGLAAGCDANGGDLFSDAPVVDGEGGAGGQGGGELPTTKARTVDLLLVLDNSRSMTDKHEILAHTVPHLVDGLTNPACIDDADLPLPRQDQPALPGQACPENSRRIFPPVDDLHIGVITTSIGGHGSDACDPADVAQADDEAHLITRSPNGGEVETYDDLGFLLWDPRGEASPPGERSRDELVASLNALVRGAGQEGCGFEATLESWYRFLVEPDPHDRIEIGESAQAELRGTDEVLLSQRRSFLRPDSALLILTLSDENDCSLRDGGQFYFAGQLLTPGTEVPYRLPRARAACAEDPDDPCCRSCGQTPGDGCNDSGDACDTPLAPAEDHVNVRCWQQKRRFGIDFMWPVDRYVTGLTSAQIADRHGNVVANPLFSDLDPSDDHDRIRDPRLVFFGALAGVPWQDIARRSSSGEPDLNNGRNGKGRTAGGYQTAGELSANGIWSLILGDPSRYFVDPKALPEDPLMIEAIDPRSGTHPVLEEALAPPTAGYDGNSINGHEYTVAGRGDLQYACVFPLPTPHVCSGNDDCECDVPGDNPLCQQEDDSYTTTQLRAKAYPGLRQLELAKRMEMQAAVGSICPAQLDAPNQPDFGYRPFVQAVIESIRDVLD